MINFGQSCIAAKRFIIEDTIYDQFLLELISNLEQLKAGDSLNKEVDYSCTARADLAEELNEQVIQSIESGAKLYFGANDYTKGSTKFSPLVLTDIPEDSPAAKDELFGPVFSILRATDLEEAISLANASDFGLGGSIWTEDQKTALYIAEQVETGAMFINSIVASHPYIPFGGVKKSGFGRELGKNGILEFVNAKSIYLG